MDKLEYLLAIPGDLTLGDLRRDSDWDELREHPRFQALLAKDDG